jgi:hypothetical protein
MPASPNRYMLCTGQIVTRDRMSLFPKSHIVGALRYVEDEGARVLALVVFERSVSVADVVGGVLVLGIQEIRIWVIGDARGVKCTVASCKKVQRWEIDDHAYQALRRKRDDLKEVIAIEV